MIARTAHCTFFDVDFKQAARMALWTHDPNIYLAWWRANKLNGRAR